MFGFVVGARKDCLDLLKLEAYFGKICCLWLSAWQEPQKEPHQFCASGGKQGKTSKTSCPLTLLRALVSCETWNLLWARESNEDTPCRNTIGSFSHLIFTLLNSEKNFFGSFMPGLNIFHRAAALLGHVCPGSLCKNLLSILALSGQRFGVVTQ